MGSCLKGKSESQAKEGNYRCEKCGAVTARKGHACEPKKIKPKKKPKKKS